MPDRKRKPGFYISVERNADKVVTITQTLEKENGSSQSTSMRLMPLEANMLSLILNRHLQDNRRRSAYVGKDRK